MANFTQWLAAHWPIDLAEDSPSLEALWSQAQIYTALEIQAMEWHIASNVLQAWLFTADPLEATDPRLPIPPVEADPLSGISVDRLAVLREILETYDVPEMSTDPLTLVRTTNIQIARGEIPVGYLTRRLRIYLETRRQAIIAQLPPPVKLKKKENTQQKIKVAGSLGLDSALAEMEQFLLQSARPIPLFQPSAYCKLIRDRYGVKIHLLASPATAFYPIFGSHNDRVPAALAPKGESTFESSFGEDVYGNLGDVMRDRASWERFVDASVAQNENAEIRIEISAMHLGNYLPVLFQFLVDNLLLTDLQATAFMVIPAGTIIPSSLDGFIVPDQRRQIDNARELLILSNEGDQVVKDTREFEDVLICLGWRYIAPPKTIPRLTNYEKAVAIGKRAVGLANGEKMVLSDVSREEIDLLNIAEREFNEGKLPVEVIRRLPNGQTVTFDPNTNRY